jgi:cytochrome c oxidase subunit IV
MLKKAAGRYDLKNRFSLWVILPLLLIDAGITVSYFQRLTGFAPWERIGLVQIIYIPVLLTAFLVGVLFWRKRQKPLRDTALILLKEFQD